MRDSKNNLVFVRNLCISKKSRGGAPPKKVESRESPSKISEMQKIKIFDFLTCAQGMCTR